MIQDGAKLVQTVDDILVELGVLTLKSPDPETETPPVSPAIAKLPEDQRAMLDRLTLQPTHADALIVQTGLTVAQVNTLLTLLELERLARRVPGNAFVRVL